MLKLEDIDKIKISVKPLIVKGDPHASFAEQVKRAQLMLEKIGYPKPTPKK